jgi:hypothetical protein
MIDYTTFLTGQSNIPLWLIAIALIWSLIWKGFALWKAARKNSPAWFIALLVINTLGILEILYLFLFSKIDFEHKEISPTNKQREKIWKKPIKKK